MVAKKKIFFTIVRICTLFFAGLIVASIIALSQLNLENLRGNLITVLRDATGLPVEIQGKISWKLSLRPQVELNQVRVANADWAKHEYAFSADKIDVTLDLISLFRDRPSIQNVKVYNATVCIEKNSDGLYAVQPFADKKQLSDEDKELAEMPPVYPFDEAGLGGVEIKNLSLHVFESEYFVSGLQVRYRPRAAGREYSGWLRSENDVFPFILSFAEYNSERKVYPVQLAMSTGGDALIANVALEGTSKLPIDFIIKGEVPSLSALGRILNLDLSDVPPLTLNVVGGFDRNKLTLRKSSVFVRGTDFIFSGFYDWGHDLPTFRIDVNSKQVSLMKLFPGLYGRKWVRPNRDLNVFKDVPLFGKYLVGTNMDLRVQIDEFLIYRDLVLNDVDVDLVVKNTDARLDVLTGMADGNIQVGADIKIATDGELDVVAAGQGYGVSVGEILNRVHKNNLISDLPVGTRFYVRAHGTDLSGLMGTLTGPVMVYSNDSGYAHSALVAYMYGTDFLTTLRHTISDLFSSEKKHDQIKISCAVINTKFRDGRAETQHGVALETNAINMRLAGYVDFAEEKMRMALTTVPVRGLKLSLTGNVVNSIEITGNLAEPDIKINGVAVAGKALSATGLGLLLAPFTGGIGLVAGAGVGLLAGDLLENWLSDGHPCETAIERGAPVRRDDPEWMGTPIEELVETVLLKDA